MDVMKRVREHYEFAKTIVPEDRIIGIFLVGSQNYNMHSESSDVDTKVLVVPSFEDVVLDNRAFNDEFHLENGEHVTFTDIRSFMDQLRKQNPNTLEVLFTKYCIRNNDFSGIWYYLWNHREEVAHYRPQSAVNTMRHMANREYKRMEKSGFTTKGLALIFRLEKLMADYLIGVKYENALASDQAEFLKKVKYGEFVNNADEGMCLAHNSIDCINKWADRFCEQTEDTIDTKVGAIMMKVQRDFIADSLNYDIVEYRSKR